VNLLAEVGIMRGGRLWKAWRNNMYQSNNNTSIESAEVRMKWVEGGIPMPDWIEDYPLYIAVIDGKPQYLNFDGDNGIHAFDGENLKYPYETRAKFLAVVIEGPPINFMDDNWNPSVFEWMVDGCGYNTVFEGFVDWFIQYAPKVDEVITMKASLVWMHEVDYWGEHDTWLEDITID
jgi:hypothetical protein